MSENLISENENTASELNKEASETPTATPTTIGQTENAAETAANVQETEAVANSAVVKIEGQEFPLPVSIAAEDDLLKAALSPHYPSIKNANISRETRLGEMIVSIVKKAEHKGGDSGGRRQAA